MRVTLSGVLKVVVLSGALLVLRGPSARATDSTPVICGGTIYLTGCCDCVQGLSCGPTEAGGSFTCSLASCPGTSKCPISN